MPTDDPDAELGSGGRRIAPVVLGVVLALWCLLPLVTSARFVIDAIPMVTAGDLVGEVDAAVLYPPGARLGEQDPAFEAHACADPDIDPDCRPFGAFLSPPAAYPVVWAVAALPDGLPIRAWLVVAVVPLAAAVALLATRRFFRERPWLLVAAAVALTPWVIGIAPEGQSSSLLVLALVAGSLRSRTAQVVAGVSLAVVAALKLTPVVLIVLAVVAGKRLLAAVAAGGFAALALVGTLLEPGGWGAFVHSARAVNGSAALMLGNGSWVAYLGDTPVSLAVLAALAVTALVVAGRRGPAMLWVVGWTVVVLVSPLVWFHYLGVPVAAVLVSAADDHAVDRAVAGIVLAVAASVAGSTIDGLPASNIPIVVAALAALLVLGRRQAPDGVELTPPRAAPGAAP